MTFSEAREVAIRLERLGHRAVIRSLPTSWYIVEWTNFLGQKFIVTEYVGHAS